MLNHRVTGVVLALALVSPAAAADMLGDASLRGISAPLSQYSSQDWSGAYMGVYGGLPLHSNMTVRPGPLTSPYISGAYKTTVSGGGGGVLAGFNAQEGSFVFGGEADVGVYDLKARESLLMATSSVDTQVRANYLATFRGRVGFAAGPMLFYATGGAAVTTLKGSISGTSSGVEVFRYTNNQTVFGYAVGAGIEYAVSNAFNLRAEYLYTAFNRANYADAARVKLNAGFARLGIVSQF